MSLTETRFSQTQTFNKDILGIEPRLRNLLPKNEYSLSYTQLMEEANEFLEAAEKADYIGCVDAIIDNLYFAYGILYKLGLDESDINSLFSLVHHANMMKRMGVKPGREGHGNAADAVKPSEWVDPRKLMEQYFDATSHAYNN